MWWPPLKSNKKRLPLPIKACVAMRPMAVSFFACPCPNFFSLRLPFKLKRYSVKNSLSIMEMVLSCRSDSMTKDVVTDSSGMLSASISVIFRFALESAGRVKVPSFFRVQPCDMTIHAAMNTVRCLLIKFYLDGSMSQ